MNDNCKICESKTTNPRPAKFSIEDKYASYRRKAKLNLLEEKGLI